MFENPSDETIRTVLQNAKTIAIVGLSDNPQRESYTIAKEMQKRGYRIVPVNPSVHDVLGETAYPTLHDIPFQVDIADIFRKSDALPSVVQDAIQTEIPVIWAQLGLFSEEAAELARKHHKMMIMDRCIMVTHSLLVNRDA